MRAIEKGAVISGVGALLLGASLALSSPTAVSSATTAHSGARPAPAKASTCSSKSGFCLSVQNTSSGGAIVGTATSNDGLFGQSSTGFGVYGLSTSNDGVFGDSSDGVGVSGSSSSSDGVDGNAANAGNGVSGQSSSGNGVSGQSTSGSGVFGESTNLSGVSGYSDNYIGGIFSTNSASQAALYAQAGTEGGSLFGSANLATGGAFNVDDDGDGDFSGTVTATKFIDPQRSRGGRELEAFSPESTRATIEDTGTARLDAGEGVVRFDSEFASTIDVARGYQVFLTPNGETRGWLYVASKYEGGFIVREGLHGRSSVYFDYRVVAHPYGASDVRLPQLQMKRPPIPKLPEHARPRQP